MTDATEAVSARAHELGLHLDPRTVGRLVRLADILEDRAIRLGMIARGDAGRVLARHVLDGLRVVPIIPKGTTSVADLGSGAGLPGLVVAVSRPDLGVTLVEPSKMLTWAARGALMAAPPALPAGAASVSTS